MELRDEKSIYSTQRFVLLKVVNISNVAVTACSRDYQRSGKILLPFISTMEMKAVCSCETLVIIYESAWCDSHERLNPKHHTILQK
jgi:hypothetical protein